MFLLNLLAQTTDAATAAAEQAPAQEPLVMATRHDMSLLDRLFFPARGSSYAPGVDDLFLFVFWVCVIFFLLVMVPYAYFIFKYRRKPGVPAERSASHNTPLELAWSIGPLFILAIMFFWGFETYVKGQVAPFGAEEIRVKGSKWIWQFEYDNGATPTKTHPFGSTDAPIFAIPAGRPIKLILDSKDVIHSFYVPDFRKKIDIYPNRYVSMWFESLRPGETHQVYCAEYCGDQHSEMAAFLQVLPEQEYQEWKQKNLLDPSTLTPADYGQYLYRSKGCSSCHTIDGTKGTGPSWLGVYGTTERFQGGGSAQVDENYIRESILTPAVNIVEGYSNQMTSFQGQITDKEMDAIIAFIKSLSDAGRAELEAAAAAKGDAAAPAEGSSDEGAAPENQATEGGAH